MYTLGTRVRVPGPEYMKRKVDFSDKERVRGSPYYLGNQLWDKLDVNIQLSKNLLLFGNEIKKIDVSNL